MLRKKSLRIRYLISVLTIMIPVLVFSMVIQTYNTNNNRLHVGNAITSNFARAISSVDALLSSMDTLIEKHFSPRSSRLKDGGNTGMYVAQALAWIQNELDNSVIVSCYQRGSDRISVANQTIPYAEFEQLFEDNYNLSTNQFFTNLLKVTLPTLMQVSPKAPGSADRLLVYMNPILLADSREVYVFSFMIRTSLITSYLREYMGDVRGDLFMYKNAADGMAFEVLQGVAPRLPEAEVYKVKGIGFFEHPQDNLCIVRDLSNRGITYVMAADLNQVYTVYSGDNGTLRMWMIVLLVSCFCLAVAIALFNYQPIRNLAREIVGQNLPRRDGNELHLIKKQFAQTEEEKEALALRLNSQNTMMLAQLCIKLAGGSVSGMAELEYLASCADFSFEHPFNFALFIQLPPAQADAADHLMELCALFQSPHTHGMSGELFRDHAVCMIINYAAPAERHAARSHEIARELLAFLQSKGVDGIIGVGNAYQSPLELHDSYLEAASTAVHSQYTSTQRLFFYNDTPDEEKAPYAVGTIPQAAKSLLIESIRQGDQTIAQRALSQVFAWLQNEPNSVLLLRLHSVSLVNTIVDSVRPFNINPDSKQLTALMTLDTEEAFLHNIRDMVADFCAQVKSKIQLSDILVKKQLLDFIAGHYTQADFSLQLVIDSLHIGKNRINTILKEDVSMGFAQYVSWLRLNQFRRLLLTTNRSIQDLVAEVGYVDVSSFLRKFKSTEGVTAGQFRAQHAAADNTALKG